MKQSTIGILQVDGSFFPVVEETYVGKKRLVLVAARADQETVKIDIRRSDDGTVKTGAHLGTLALQKSGDGDVELLLDLDSAGHLTASASWPKGGPLQSIAVDLNDYRDSSIFEAEPDPLEPVSDEEATSDDASGDLRSDHEILADTSLDSFELDDLSLDELNIESPSLDEIPLDLDPQESEQQSLTLDLPDLDDFNFSAPSKIYPTKVTTPKDADFDLPSLDSLDDLDAGFGVDSEIESKTPAKPATTQTDPYDFPDLSLDDETPSIELSDSPTSFDVDSSDSMLEMPDIAADQPTEEPFSMPDWQEPVSEASSTPQPQATKPRKNPANTEPAAPNQGFAPVDKLALVLSLTTLGLLIVVLLGLLFMNFLKPISPPAIKPEVFLPPVSSMGLAMANEKTDNPLEVPASLRGGSFSYTLKPGDHERDLLRQLGPVSAERRSDSWVW